MLFRPSSSPSGSPLFSGAKWAEQPLQLPTSLPIRYQQLRGTGRRRFITLTLLGLLSLALLVRIVPNNAPGEGLYEHLRGIPSLYAPGSAATQAQERSCRLDLSSLASFDLTNDFTYARRYIKRMPFKKGPNPKANLAWVDEMNKSLFAGLERISLSSAEQGSVVDLQACSRDPFPMYMRHEPKPVDARGLVFGLASTSERLLDFAPTMALWLANTGAHLLAIVPTGPLVQELRTQLDVLGINATVLTSNEAFLVNYFKLVEAFHSHAGKDDKWFTFIDDDTHYFSLRRFTEVLHARRPEEEIYVGAVSEDLRQIRWDGLFAFGGAGVTVSRALLERLHENYYVCLSEQSEWEPGDVRLKRCVYQHTETKLTMIEGLHQVDLEGETSGIMEGPRPPISWHHYRSWSPQNVKLISQAGEVCGASCLFQRWKFPVSSDFGYVFMTLHFGVSIIGYSVGIRPDLSKTEMTWRDMPGSNFDHSLAPLRMGLVEGRDRFTYRLRGVGKDVDGHVKHTYIKYAVKEQQKEAEPVGEAKDAKDATDATDAKDAKDAAGGQDSPAAAPVDADKRSLYSSVDEVMELVFL